MFERGGNRGCGKRVLGRGGRRAKPRTKENKKNLSSKVGRQGARKK